MTQAMTENVVTIDTNTYESLQQELAMLRQQVIEQSCYRDKAETALKQCKAQMRLFMEHAPAAVAMFDRHMRYLLVSRRWLEDYGLGEQNIIGRSHYEIFPEIPDRWKAMHQRCLSGAIEKCDEDAFPRPNGTIDWIKWEVRPWYDERGEIGGIIMFAELITQQKQAEASLLQLNEELEARITERTAQLYQKTWELQAILDAFPDLVYRLKSDSTIIDYKAGQNNSQLHSSKGFLGQKIVKLLPRGVAKQIEQAIIQTLKTQSLVSLEYTLPMSGGEVHYEGRFLPFDSGQVILIVRDVTQRKQAEIGLKKQAEDLERTLKELQQTQFQLVQTEKMSSLGQLVAGIAHEINNPVNFIHGNLVYAQEYGDDLLRVIQAYQKYYPHPQPEIAALIEQVDINFLLEDFSKVLGSMQVGAVRIQEIIAALRNFSRLDEAEVKEVDIHVGIDSTLTILQNRLKARAERPEIQVIKDYEKLPLVECYAGQLNQVFMNILANAIDALEERDTCWRTGYRHRFRTFTEIKQYPSWIRIATELADAGSQVRITISDNGPGIAPEIKCRIFEPFFTTKPIGKGTGLGMSISHQIITEKHKGSLECISSVGEGTAFVIQIPISQGTT